MITGPIRRILVPTDMSDFGVAALAHAEMLQNALGGAVTALFVHQPLYPDLAGAEALVSDREFHKFALDQLAEHVRSSVSTPASVDLLVEDGFPARTILKAAKDIEADLIVMGTHGRSGWRRALLGSVTERVLHEASCAVMTVTPTAVQAQARVTSILCPVDYSAAAHDALRTASWMAQRFDAKLIVVNVTTDLQASLEPSVRETYERWVDSAIRQQCRYIQLIVGGDPGTKVLELAAERGASLIVIGAQHKRFSDASVLGTTTERVIRFARQPVITVIHSRLAPQPEAAPEDQRREEFAMLVKNAMTWNPASCTPETKLADVARLMAQYDCGEIPVCENEKVLGVITDRDIAIRAVAERRNLHDVPARQVMSAPAITVEQTDDVYLAMRLMKERQIRRLPVTSNGKLVGMLSIGDIALKIAVPISGELLASVSKPAMVEV